MAGRTKLEEAKAVVRERVLSDRSKAPEELRKLFDRLARYLFEAPVNKIEPSWRRRKRFHQTMGLSVGKYIIELKGETAKWLISNTKIPLGEIGRLLGGRSQNFSRDFLAWTGQNALSFRKANSPLRRVGRDLRKAGHRRSVTPLLMFSGEPPAAKALADLVWSLLAEEVPPRQRYFLKHEIRFFHRALFDKLLDVARQIGRHDRRRGVEAMRLLLAFVEGSAKPLDNEACNLRILALAWQGNAYRLARAFPLAEKYFREAEAELSDQSVNERALGQLWYLKASFRLDQRRFDETRRLLDIAVAHGEKAGDVELVVDALMQRASLAGYEGKPANAIPDVMAAVNLLGPIEEKPRQHLLALRYLGLICAECEKLNEARRAQSMAWDLLKGVDDPSSRWSLHWVDGLIAYQEGNMEAAERDLRRARAGFLEINDCYSAAIASLDLAILFHVQRRTVDVCALIKADVLPVVTSLQIEREGLAAINLLREAVSGQQSVSVTTLRRARCAVRFLR